MAKRRSASGMWHTFRTNRVAQVGTAVILIAAAVILLVRLFSPYGPTGNDYMNILRPPSLSHPFGTDSFGRDVLTRVVYGAQVSLLISFAGLLLGGLIGTVIGMVSGFWGGVLDAVTMRFIDLLYSFPTYVLALCLMLLLGYGSRSVSLAIALIYVPNFARLARSMTEAIRAENYVTAARLMGQSPPRILLREILPNIAAPLLVQFSAGLGFGIIMEAGLSFVGLGVQPPTPSWGGMIDDGRKYLALSWSISLCPGLAIAALIMAINTLGDQLRDTLDPHLAED